MKVLIVGGGAVGAACALSLAERGADVTVLDADDPPGGSTARGEGMLMLANKEPHAALQAMRAIESWRGLLPKISDIEFKPLRTILVALDEPTAHRLAERAGQLNDAGMTVRQMSGDGCRSEDPGLSKEVRYGIRVDDSAHVQPMLAGLALLRAACAAGAKVRRRVRVMSVSPGEVVTSCGSLRADEVVVAAGAASAPLLADTGYEIPIEPRRGHLLVAERRAAEIVRTGALGGGYMTAVQSKDAGLHVVPNVEVTASGTVLLGTSRERVGFDMRISIPTMRRIAAETARLYPALRDYRIIRAWVGFRPWTPDKEPLVGRLCAGLGIAAGHEGEGITYAPLTGSLIANALLDDDVVTGGWDPLRFTRAAQAVGGAISAAAP